MSDVETDTLLMVVRREEGGAAAANKATVDWALSRLERGQDTPGLLILASLSSPFSSWEVDQYLKQALQELGESLPNRDVALWWRARSLARQIVDDPSQSTDRLEAKVTELAQICIALDYPGQLLNLYGDDDFRPSYHLGPFNEAEWRANVAADAQDFLAGDGGGK